MEQALHYVIGANRAAVLPSVHNPKLIVPMCGLTALWRLTAFYPAFKLRAKPWRMLQRLAAISGVAPKAVIPENEDLFRFVNDVFPDITHSSVLLGTPGVGRKIIIQLWQAHKLVGYIKVATTETAKDKINNEAEILGKLPAGLGPKLLKGGHLGGSTAMILSPAEGKMLDAKLSKPFDRCKFADVLDYLELLQISNDTYAIDKHPAIQRIKHLLSEAGAQCLEQSVMQFDQWLEPMRTQNWPVVIQHGDFAPWNVLRQEAESVRNEKTLRSNDQYPVPSSLCAIDWEEGTTEGFPYFDLIHYISQTAALALKWDPSRFAAYIKQCLADIPEEQRIPIARLGMLQSYFMIDRTLERHHWVLDWKIAVLEQLK
jgi:hypothetical protein